MMLYNYKFISLSKSSGFTSPFPFNKNSSVAHASYKSPQVVMKLCIKFISMIDIRSYITLNFGSTFYDQLKIGKDKV